MGQDFGKHSSFQNTPALVTISKSAG